jgi:hypothetical protein
MSLYVLDLRTFHDIPLRISDTAVSSLILLGRTGQIVSVVAVRPGRLMADRPLEAAYRLRLAV